MARRVGASRRTLERIFLTETGLPLGAWRRHDPARQALMRRELERVLAAPELSKNTYEMVSKSLA